MKKTALLLGGAILIITVITITSLKQFDFKTPYVRSMTDKLSQSSTAENTIQEVESNIPIEEKEEQIKEILKGKKGYFGVYINYLEKANSKIQINSTEKFYAASVSKVPLLITLYRLYETDPENFYPEKKVFYLEEDSEWGDGSIQKSEYGSAFTLEEIATRLAKESDNVAKNMLYRILPWEEIAVTYKTVDVEPNTQENEFTVLDMARFWEELWISSRSITNPSSSPSSNSVSARSTFEILDLLQNTTTEERIPAEVPEGVKVSHKIGTWSPTGSWHDCGIVFSENPVLICVFSKNSTYEEAVETIREVTKIAVR